MCRDKAVVNGNESPSCAQIALSGQRAPQMNTNSGAPTIAVTARMAPASGMTTGAARDSRRYIDNTVNAIRIDDRRSASRAMSLQVGNGSNHGRFACDGGGAYSRATGSFGLSLIAG